MQDQELPIADLILTADHGRPEGLVAVVSGPYGAMSYFVARVQGCQSKYGGDGLQVLPPESVINPNDLVS